MCYTHTVEERKEANYLQSVDRNRSVVHPESERCGLLIVYNKTNRNILAI